MRTCFNIFLIFISEEATRVCHENGSWFKRDGFEWTDYTTCLNRDVRL